MVTTLVKRIICLPDINSLDRVTGSVHNISPRISVKVMVAFYPAATIGRVTLMLPAAVWTLFAMAIALWNWLVFTSSMEKVPGSLALLVQEIVASPPDVRLLGIENSMAKTKGRKKRMTLDSGRSGRTIQMERSYVT